MCFEQAPAQPTLPFPSCPYSLQDPMEVVNKYGADALRLYLINSPVVSALAPPRAPAPHCLA